MRLYFRACLPAASALPGARAQAGLVLNGSLEAKAISGA